MRMTSCSPDRTTVDYLDLYAVPAVDENEAVKQDNGGDDSSACTSSRAIRRLSLQVSADLHRQLKLLAMDEEETMNSMVVRILRKFLKNRDIALQEQNSRRFV